ncbi:MAG: tape measure protein [Acidobacteriota bacterium]|nr:tape measure protein [Acidobacteriota bacterium]
MADNERKVYVRIIPKAGDGKPVLREFKSLFDKIKSEGEKVLTELEKSHARLSKAASQIGFGGVDIAAIKRRYAELDSLTKAQQRFAFANLRTEQREFERVQRAKQRAAELSSIGQIQASRQAFTAIENQRKRDYQEFVRLEKEKTRAAQQTTRQPKSGSFGDDVFANVFGGATLAGFTVNAVSSILGGIQSGISRGFGEAVAAGVTASNFQRTKIAIAGVVGSASEADSAIAKLEQTAINTPGLTFRNALEGYQRLRAVQFGAKDAESALVGLSKVKILSGGTKEDLQAVLINFAQIRSVGKLTGDELRETLGRFPYFAQVLEKAFGTISTEKIGELGLSSEAFFKRIFAEMEKIPSVAGGAGEAFDKLTDEFFKAQTAFGTPLLEPITESIQTLTEFLRNNKDNFAEWGQATGDIISGLNKKFKDFQDYLQQNPIVLPVGNGDTAKRGEDLFKQSGIGKPFALSTSEINRILGTNFQSSAERGADERRKKLLAEQLKPSSDLSLGTSVFKGLDDAVKKAADEEVRRYRETTKEIETNQKIRLANSADYYTRQTALISDSLRLNTEQELNYQLKANAIEKNQADGRLAILSGSIAKQRALNEKLIDSYLPQDRGRIRGVKELELAEKVAAVAQETAKLQVDEANRRREVLELERRISDERRQSAIEAKKLQGEQSRFGFDNQLFDIQRALENQFVSAESGYAKLIELTQKSYRETSRITIESYQLQLQDLSLTKEKRLNLTTEMYLSEQKLAEDNRRAILQIQDKAFDAQIQRLENYRQRVAASFQSLGETYSSIQNAFFNPQTFSNATTGTLQNVLLKKPQTDELNNFINLGKKAESDIFNQRKALPNDAVNQSEKLTKSLAAAIDKTTEYQGALINLQDTIPKAFFELEKLSKEIGTGNVEAFDKAGKKILEYRQLLARTEANAEIDHITDLIKLENVRAQAENRTANVTELNFRKAQALRAAERLEIDQAAESVEQYQNSLEGLRQTLERYRQGDTAGLQYEAERSFLKERISLQQENIALEQGFYRDSEFLAEQRKNKLLGYEREIFEIRQEIAEKGIFNQSEADLKVLDFVNSQVKGLTDTFADFRIGLAGTYLDAVTSPFDALSKKLEGLNPIVRGLAETFLSLGRDIVKAFSSKLILQLLGLGGSGNGLSVGGGQNGGKQNGGILSGIVNSIRGLFGGSGNSQAISGTPNFNPNLLNFAGVGGGSATRNPFAADFGFGGASGASTTNPFNVLSQSQRAALGGSSNSSRGGGLLGALGFAGIGASLGVGLGGGSRAGQIVGGVGVGALGLLGGIALPSILAGTFAGLTALGAATFGIGLAAIPLALILSRNAKRKKEEKLRTQYLQESFKGLEGFDQIIRDVKSLRIEGSVGISQGESLGSTIRAQYLAQAQALKDKKTRAIAVRDVSRIDEIIKQKLDELRKVADIASAAGLRANRIIPEFARGGYFADYFKPNGLLPGRFDGRDDILARISKGEMILNPSQIRAVITRAGHDVFAGVVPNYPKAASGQRFAEGGRITGVQQSSPVIKVELNNVNVQPNSEMILHTENGKKQVLKIFTDARANKVI